MRILNAKLNTLITLMLFMSLFAFMFASLLTSPAIAAPNQQINYQGKLTDASNLAVPDGTYNMRFWLLTSPTIATTSAVWTESLTGTNKVTVTNGLFSIMLGSTTPFTGVDFNQTLYLGVEIGGTTTPGWDGEMSPRKILGTVPAAFEADKLDGLTSSQFVRTDATSSIAASTADTLLSITQNGAGDILNILDGTTEVLSVLDGGNVGIGSTTPGYRFTVQGGDSYFGGNLTATGTLSLSGLATFANGFVSQASSTILTLSAPSFIGTNATITNATTTNLAATSFKIGSDLITDITGTNLSVTNGVLNVASTADGVSNWNLVNGALAPTTTSGTYGIRVSASSTLGDGTGAGGLTISGNSTTTLNAYIGGTLGIGTTSPSAILALTGSGTGNLFAFASSTGSNLLSLDARGVLNFGTTTSANIFVNGGPTTTSITNTSLLGNNIAIGQFAFSYPSTTNSSVVTDNIALGQYALYGSSSIPMTGSDNFAVGRLALSKNTSGSNNIGIGELSLLFNTTGSKNIAIGQQSLRLNTIGENNVAIGDSTLFNNTTGSNNSGFGQQALYSNTTGASSTALGYRSGYTNATGNLNTYLGAYTDSLSFALSNVTALGAYAIAGRSNSMVLGGSGANSVDIVTGTSTPWAKFSIQNNYGSTTALFDIATTTSSAYATSSIFRVNHDGKIGIGTTTPSQLLTVAGGMHLTGGLYDRTASAGTNGMVLQTTGSGVQWVATSSLGITAGASALSALTDVNTGAAASGTVLVYDSGTSKWEARATSTLGITGGSGVSDWNQQTTAGVLAPSTTVGIRVSASSTIGNGTGSGGLTVLGNSTTTLNAYVGGAMGIGSTSPQGLLTLDKSGITSAGVAGLKEYFQFAGNTLNATYFGDNMNIVNAGTATSTLVGKLLRIEDNSALGNVVRGLEIQAHRGSNIKGENTALNAFGRTFGVKGTTEGDAGDTARPAGVFAETRGTTQGNALRAYSGSITTESLVSFYQDTSVFNGTALAIEMAAGGGSFSGANSRFIDLKNGGTSKFTILHNGFLGIGSTTPSAQISVTGTSTSDLFRFASSTGSSLLTLDARGVLNFGTTTSANIFVNGGPTTTALLGSSANQNNIAIGNGAFSYPSTTTDARNNIALGYRALYGSSSVPMTGDLNVGVGNLALSSNTSGSFNAAAGASALLRNTTGAENSAFGYETMFSNTAGGYNSAFGRAALYSSNGLNNSAFGYYSLLTYNGTGTIGIGYKAGDALTNGDRNIIIGYNNDFANASTSFALNIGNLIYGTGVDGEGTTLSSGNIGIGSSTPSRKLTVAGDIYTSNNITAASATLSYASTTGLTAANLFSTNGYFTLASTTYASTTALSIYGSLFDRTSSAGTNGMVLQTTGSGVQWVATSSLGITGSADGGSHWVLTAGGDALTPSSTKGLAVFASSTIGGGTEITGLTIFGGATTTGTANLKSLNIGNSIASNEQPWVYWGGTKFLSASSTNFNTFLGLGAGTSTLGYSSLSFGTYNTGVGHEALQNIKAGTGNTALGYRALFSNYNTAYNTAVGNNALLSNIGNYNTAIGASALITNETGQYNSAIGYQALGSSINGTDNTGIGYGALYSNTTGGRNVAIGNLALYYQSAATNTVAIGYYAGFGSAGHSNRGGVYVGYRSGYSLQTNADYNTFLGYQAGFSNTTGGYNIAIGQNVNVASSTGNQQLNIGNILFGTGIYNGGTLSSSATSDGAIAIGTSSPWARLSIQGALGSTTALFDIATTTSASYATSSIFRVNHDGNIGIGTTTPSQLLTVAGGMHLTGGLYDRTASAGTNGMVLQTTGSGVQWVATSTLGLGGGSSNWTDNGSYLSPLTATDGLIVRASSTIGDGTATGGLTVFGNSTTTLSLYIGGNFTTHPNSDVDIGGALSITSKTTDVYGGALNVSGGELNVSGGELNVTGGNITTEGFVRIGPYKNQPNANLDIENSTFMNGGLFDLVRVASSTDGLATSTYFLINKYGNVGIGTTTPSQLLTVAGGMHLTGGLYDRTASAGTNGMVLQTTGSGVQWVATSSLGLGGGSSNWTDNGSYLSPLTGGDGIIVAGSSTIGGGTGATGLTISGGATTTGNAYIGGKLSIGSTSPLALLTISNSVNTPAGTPLFTIASTTGGTATSTLFQVTAGGNVVIQGNGTSTVGTGNLISGENHLTSTSTYNTYSTLFGAYNTLSDTAILQSSSLYGDSNTLSGSSNLYLSSLYGDYNDFTGNAILSHSSLYGYDNTLSDSANLNYSSLYGDFNIATNTANFFYSSIYGGSNRLSGSSNLEYSSLYGGSNRLSGSAYLSSVSLYGDSNNLSNTAGLDSSSLYGDANVFSDDAVLTTTSVYGAGNSFSGESSTFTSLVSGDGNNFYGNARLGGSLLFGDNNIHWGGTKYYTALIGQGNNFTGGDNQIVIGDQNVIGRSYSFTVSGTTVTVVGDITPYISDGASYSFSALAGGTNNTLHQANRTISSISFGGGNTTFTISSALDDRTSGRLIVNTPNRVYVFGNNQTIDQSDYFTVNGKFNILTATGTVGIGTTTPSAMFAVAGTGSQDLFRFASSTGSSLLTLDARGVLNFGTTTENATVSRGSNIFINGGPTSTPITNTNAVGNNIALGNWAFSYPSTTNTTRFNVALGYMALYGSSSVPMTGDSNFAAGYSTLAANTSGDSNTAIGSYALGRNITGSYNIGLGANAIASNTSGNFNTGIGFQALYANTTGSDNNAVGASTLSGTTNTGSGNNAFGSSALYSNTSGSYNSGFGQQALYSNTTGASSTALGFKAGYTNATGNLNTYLGAYTDSLSSALSNVTTLGAYAIAGRSNSMVLGGSGANSVDIVTGTSTPWAKFSIQNNYGSTTALFDIATTTSSAYATSSIFRVGHDGKVSIGSSTPESLALTIQRTNIAGDSGTVAGIKEFMSFANTASGSLMYGDNAYILNSSTATTTLVGKIIRLEDSTTYGNTIRGLEVQAQRGVNTKGENTAISGFGRTFGVRGSTEGDAGSTYVPAGVFGELKGTTQGNAIRAYSGTITSSSLMQIFQDTSVFTGTGLLMNLGNQVGGVGSFASTSSKFIDLQNAGTSKFTVSAHGTTTIGDGTTNYMAGLQIGYGGLCVDNDGTCAATTTGRITAVQYGTANSDLAEMYFSSDDLMTGEIVALAGGLSISRAQEASAYPILGVVSTKPGMVMGFDDDSLIPGEVSYPVALKGRVPVRLSTENGPIVKGDRIALSSIPGVGMKATESDVVVGIALEDFTGESAYSAGYLNQFGDDLVKAKLKPLNQNTDARTQDGCSYGGGTAQGDAPCVKEKVSAIKVETVSVDNKTEVLAELRDEDAERMTTAKGEEVAVGQIIMFVDLDHHLIASETNILKELLATSSVENGDGTETLWDRVKTLAQNFVDGVLKVAGLKTDKLCVGSVCVDEAQFLEMVQSAGVGQSRGDNTETPPPAEEGVIDGGSTVDEGSAPPSDESGGGETGGVSGGSTSGGESGEVPAETTPDESEDPGQQDAPSVEETEQVQQVSEPEAPPSEEPEVEADPEPEPEPTPEPPPETPSEPTV